MRIKTDFVTNSSSTAYIVCVPQDFMPTREEIDITYKNHNIYYEHEPELTEDDLYEKLPHELMDYLKDGDNLWYYGSDGCDSRLFSMIVDICENHSFMLSIFDINGEGNNRLQGIKEDEIKKWFMDTQLQKLSIEVNNE